MPTHETADQPEVRHVLVTGATGYIGGRLVAALLDEGKTVRCLARTPAKLEKTPWRATVEVVQGDVTDSASLEPALKGIDAAYYLIHSIGAEGDWEERDRVAAATFRDAAARAGVRQIIYLGGLGDADADDDGQADELSKHLASRHEVGAILADGPVPVTELRAAVIIGSGSASFEMLRHLTEKLPVMITPKWVRTRCQPIAVRDILAYLVGVLGRQEALGQTFDVGGPDVVTYEEMMHGYAEVAGLPRRRIIGVPFLSPGLSSLWIGLVTPLPPPLARPLIHSLVNEVVANDDRIHELVPRDLLPYKEAVRLAISRVEDLEVSTTWSGADTRLTPADAMPTDPDWAGGTVLEDVRAVRAVVRPEALFATISAVGGDTGYYSPRIMWQARGLLDLVFGGIGMRKGRRHPTELRVGDTVDFWRVERVVPNELVRLRAEMTLPGEAWLEWRIRGEGLGSCFEQRARFHPRGLWGRLYWYALVPAHAVVFSSMTRKIVAAAEQWQRDNPSPE